MLIVFPVIPPEPADSTSIIFSFLISALSVISVSFPFSSSIFFTEILPARLGSSILIFSLDGWSELDSIFIFFCHLTGLPITAPYCIVVSCRVILAVRLVTIRVSLRIFSLNFRTCRVIIKNMVC